MATATLRSDERWGLAVAVLLHLALVVAFLVQPERSPALPEPERMTVNLSEEVGLEATAPDPVPQSRAAIAPTLSPDPAPAPVEAQPSPIVPAPAPVAVERPRPAPQPRAAPRPTRAPSSNAPRRRPDTPSSSRPSVVPARPNAPAKSGGSRIGDDFLPGAGDSANTDETRIPASQIGASAKASIIQAITRQIKPHWSAPQGPDAELLITTLSFRLNPDGSLSGTPRVIGQSGDNATNAAQKDLHAERAIRAVQLAAPFDLPPEYYEAWKSISGARFDRNLSR